MHLRPRIPSHQAIVSYVGLFVALGGVSYAVVKLPSGSIGNRELRGGAVVGSRVRDRSLIRADVSRGTSPAGLDGPAGAPGLPGETGEAGPQGPRGDRGGDGARTTLDPARFYDSGQSDGRFLGASATASDTAALSGRDPTAFARGTQTRVVGGRLSLPARAKGRLLTVESIGRLDANCMDLGQGVSSGLSWLNTSGVSQALSVFVEDGTRAADTFAATVAPSSTYALPLFGGKDALRQITLTASTAAATSTITIAVVNRPGDAAVCEAFGTALTRTGLA
jgi:hypothetical protein